jgi:hypothetical protein
MENELAGFACEGNEIAVISCRILTERLGAI